MSLQKRNNFFSLPKTIRTPFLITYLMSLIMGLAALTMYFRIQPVIPIFYSLAEPSQHLAPKEWVFLIPGISIGISFFHTLLVRLLKDKKTLLLKLFAWTTTIIQTIFFLSLLRILLIIS